MVIPVKAEVGAQHFGFSSELSARMNVELRRFYKSLIGKGDPLELDEARSQQMHLERVEADVAQILRQLK